MKIITYLKKLLTFALLINNVFLLRLNSENSNEIQNEIKEGESNQEEIAGQIYLKGMAEKHKKSHSTTFGNTSLKKKVESKAKSNDLISTQPTGNTKTTTYKSPILAELWVKYFKYTNAQLNVKTPKTFFVNSGYYQQSRLYPNVDYNKGKDFIRDKNYFYLSVFEKSLVLNSSKMVNKLKILFNLKIDSNAKKH